MQSIILLLVLTINFCIQYLHYVETLWSYTYSYNRRFQMSRYYAQCRRIELAEQVYNKLTLSISWTPTPPRLRLYCHCDHVEDIYSGWPLAHGGTLQVFQLCINTWNEYESRISIELLTNSSTSTYCGYLSIPYSSPNTLGYDSIGLGIECCQENRHFIPYTYLLKCRVKEKFNVYQAHALFILAILRSVFNSVLIHWLNSSQY